LGEEMVWREKGWFWNKARTEVVQYMYGTYVQEMKQNSTKKMHIQSLLRAFL